jgi:hypothetical protein
MFESGELATAVKAARTKAGLATDESA